MALGGGTFFVQNKVLPGAYINFISASKASATLSDRGYAAMALELDWGVENTIFEVTNGDLQKNSMKLFGYDYTAPQLKGLRDLFLNLKTLYLYRLTSGGVKATNTYATAKYCGTRGNDLKVVISNNVEEEEKFDVSLYIDDTMLLDKQTVSQMSELVDNDYVTWKSGASLSETAGEPLSTGTNGTVNGLAHQTFLDKAESYYFNILGCVSTEDEIKSLYVAYTKRLRDEVGAKFQLVVHNKEADYEGVINVINDVEESPVSSLVYWVTGAEASCAVNASLLNKKYDGEFTVKADYTQSQLEGFINAGKFTFHNVGNDIRVLSDINTLLTTSDIKGDVFKENQTIRVCDQIANDIANIFNTRYLGVVPNDANGRISLWNDIVKHHQQLQDIRAIENFTSEDITVAQGDSKKAVVVYDKVTVVNAMAQLYMTVEIA